MKLLLENWRQYLNENINEQDVIRVLKKYHEPSLGVKRVDFDEIEDPNELMILKAVFLYTSSMPNAERVLDPSVKPKIDPESHTIRDPGAIGDTSRKPYTMLPTQQDYKNANIIMAKLGSFPNPFPNRPAYRSWRLSKEQLDNLLEKETFDLGPARSWSLTPKNVTRFGLYKLTKERNILILFIIPNPTKGMPIYNVSMSPEEEEIIIGGKIRIIKTGKLLKGPAGHRELGPGEGFVKLICETV